MKHCFTDFFITAPQQIYVKIIRYSIWIHGNKNVIGLIGDLPYNINTNKPAHVTLHLALEWGWC